MKKSTALMVFVAAAGLASCGGPTTPTANLKSDIDSLSYSLGVTNTQGLMDFAKSRLGVDSTNTSHFIQGIIEGTSMTREKDKANIAGKQIGMQVKDEMFNSINQQLFMNDSVNSLNKEKFISGFIQSIEGNGPIKIEDAMAYVRSKSESIKSDSTKTNIANSIDSLSYMLGVSNTQGLISYATTRMGVDSTCINDFKESIKEGLKISDTKQKVLVSGLQIGMQISETMFKDINNQIFHENKEISLNKQNFLAGFIDELQNKSIISLEKAGEYASSKANEILNQSIEKKYKVYKEKNEKFLLDNKNKEGIKTTKSGLQYRIIKEGKGTIPNEKSHVKVHYKGTLIDGTQFDSSYDRNSPTVFRCNQVIAGWTEALTMMPVGSKWELFIPQELGYGSRDMGNIKPFSTLIFEVELLDIEK